jgi:hypothetical protein
MSAAPNRWYRAARGFAWTFLGSAVATLLLSVFSFMLSGAQSAVPTAPATLVSDIPAYALVVSIGAFFVSAFGTASTVILGWRNERRQAAESRLKIEQLELQLAEARRQAEVRP